MPVNDKGLQTTIGELQPILSAKTTSSRIFQWWHLEKNNHMQGYAQWHRHDRSSGEYLRFRQSFSPVSPFGEDLELVFFKVLSRIPTALLLISVSAPISRLYNHFDYLVSKQQCERVIIIGDMKVDSYGTKNWMAKLMPLPHVELVVSSLQGLFITK